MGKGYWIKDQNIIDITYSTHLQEILNHPAEFGFTKKELEQIYFKHKEPFGLEQYAREEIIKISTQRGWIRVREYTTLYWSIQFYGLDTHKSTIRNFVVLAIHNGFMLDDDLLELDDLKSTKESMPAREFLNNANVDQKDITFYKSFRSYVKNKRKL
ncbi:MAG: hypothetical protein ACP5G8_05670 [Athalassotoga sp.]